jgi:hypothetical protein
MALRLWANLVTASGGNKRLAEVFGNSPTHVEDASRKPGSTQTLASRIFGTTQSCVPFALRSLDQPEMLARKLTTAGPARLSMQQVPAPSRAAPRLRRHLAIVAGLRRQKREEKEVGAPSTRAALHECCCAARPLRRLCLVWVGAGRGQAGTGGLARVQFFSTRPACAAAGVL